MIKEMKNVYINGRYPLTIVTIDNQDIRITPYLTFCGWNIKSISSNSHIQRPPKVF